MELEYDDKAKKLKVVKADRLEYRQLEKWLKRYADKYRFSPAYKRKVWDGKINHFHHGNINFGLWKEVAKALNHIDKKFILLNKEEFPINKDIKLSDIQNFCKKFFEKHYIIDDEGNKKDFFPYDYQIETAYQILKNRYCIAEVATSGGKSIILSIVYFYILKHLKPDAKLLIIVPAISLVTQFYDNLMEYNYGKQKENPNPLDIKIQEIMSDSPRKWHGEGEPNIVISTYQSLSEVKNFGKKFYEQFYAVAVDESHQAKINSLKKILNRTIKSATYRFGMSGTFQDGGTAEYLTIQSLTGPKVKRVKAKYLQDKGKISYVKISQISLNHDDKEFDEKIRKIRKNPNNGAAAYQLEGDYIRNSKERMKFLTKLTFNLKENTLLLFNIIDYGENVLSTFKKYYEHLKRKNKIDLLKDKSGNVKEFEFYYIDGSIKKDERKKILKELEKNDDTVKILIATYGTLSTGISVNNLHNIIFAESFKSELRIIQSIGRALRLHETKKMAYIYDLVDCYTDLYPNNILYNHGKERLKLYEKHEYPYTKKRFIL